MDPRGLGVAACWGNSMQFGECFRRALIVEDNQALARSLTRLVTEWGVQVLCVPTLAGALGCAVEPLDLVISDLRLPDGNGHQLFERVTRFRKPPLMVAMSGRASAAEAFALAKIGVHVFAEKPFATSHLEELIRNAIQARDSCTSHLPAKPTNGAPPELRPFARAHGLSDQQSEILRLLLQGVPRKAIPSALGVTPNTCKTIVRRLLARCGERNLSDVARKLSTWTYLAAALLAQGVTPVG